MSNNEKKEITTLNELLDLVNEQNVEKVIYEFSEFILRYQKIIKQVRTILPSDTQDMTNTQISTAKFIYYNTDKPTTGCESIIIENGDNGVVTEFKIKNGKFKL